MHKQIEWHLATGFLTDYGLEKYKTIIQSSSSLTNIIDIHFTQILDLVLRDQIHDKYKKELEKRMKNKRRRTIRN